MIFFLLPRRHGRPGAALAGRPGSPANTLVDATGHQARVVLPRPLPAHQGRSRSWPGSSWSAVVVLLMVMLPFVDRSTERNPLRKPVTTTIALILLVAPRRPDHLGGGVVMTRREGGRMEGAPLVLGRNMKRVLVAAPGRRRLAVAAGCASLATPRRRQRRAPRRPAAGPSKRQPAGQGRRPVVRRSRLRPLPRARRCRAAYRTASTRAVTAPSRRSTTRSVRKTSSSPTRRRSRRCSGGRRHRQEAGRHQHAVVEGRHQRRSGERSRRLHPGRLPAHRRRLRSGPGEGGGHLHAPTPASTATARSAKTGRRRPTPRRPTRRCRACAIQTTRCPRVSSGRADARALSLTPAPRA